MFIQPFSFFSFFHQSMAEKRFAIVEFIDEAKTPVELVPSKWLFEVDWKAKKAKCYWPSFSNNKKAFGVAVANECDPDPADEKTWKPHNVALIAKAGGKFFLNRGCRSMLIFFLADFVCGQRKTNQVANGHSVQTDTDDDGRRIRTSVYKISYLHCQGKL